MASARCVGAIASSPARSAMVRAYFQNAVVRAGAQIHFDHGEFQEPRTGLVELAERAICLGLSLALGAPERSA